MSQTAYSTSFGVELDAKQLLKRRGVIPSVETEDFGLSSEERAWMRVDLLCPSCRCGGCSLVRSDVAKPGKGNTRQIHFRFLNASGRTAHLVGCDFYALDDEPGFVRGVDVAFSANDKDTKVVRDLVCRALASERLTKSDLFRLRTWFLTEKESHSFEVKADPALIEWLYHLQKLRGVLPLRFARHHADLPGFSIYAAARRDLSAHYEAFLKSVPMVRHDAHARDKAMRLAVSHRGQALIDMSPLRPQFEKACLFASLMASLGKLNLSKPVYGDQISAGPPRALLAFSALLLFVSDWDLDRALEIFSGIMSEPAPSDAALGNIMGLNPFHDFAALEILKFASAIPNSGERAYAYGAEISATEQRILNAIG